MSSKITTIVLGIGCIVMVILYLFKGESVENSSFNKEIINLENKLIYLENKQDSLSAERHIVMMQRDSLQELAIHNDSLILELTKNRNKLKEISYEKHTSIDSSSIDGLSRIIAGFIED